MSPDLDKPIWGARAIAAEVNLDERQAYYRLCKGELPARKVGRHWVTTRRELQQRVSYTSNGPAARESIMADPSPAKRTVVRDPAAAREEARWRALQEAARLIDAMAAETDEWHCARALADAAQRVRDLKKEPARYGA